MRTRRKRGRLALVAALALMAASAGVLAHETDVLRWLELQTVDARFAVRGERPEPDDVAVVAVDAATFNELPSLQWPYPRRFHAEAIEILKGAGARTIVYDVQFTEPTKRKEDERLFNAVADAGNVVLGTSEIAPGGRTRIFGNDANVRAARARPASAQYDLDANGVIRRIPYATDGLKTMPVVAYERAVGKPPDPSRFEPDGAWIDFRGGPGSVRTLSFSRLLDDNFPADFFAGRIVVVGASAPSLQDVHPTSTTGNDQMSGAEIQAQSISTLLRGAPLHSAPKWLDIALIVLLGLDAPLPGLRLGLVAAMGAALVGNAVFLVAAQLAFNGGTIVTVVYPLAAALASTIAIVAVRYFTEVRERHRTRVAFARFVPAAVVDRVLEQAEDGLRLGGEEVLGTVLFSDIRGFTSFSESHHAAEVIDILNDYLGEMTEAIMERGGTLISYLGDGIIAIFGAPLEQDDHADRALAAAQEMLGPRLARFNAALRERGIDQPFEMGIGINSGHFMAGNVGSQERLEYTVIGDTINTAARMEGLTKGSGHSMFIAESTKFMLLRPPPPLEYVGEFAIRGREGKMKVWAPETGPGPGAGNLRGAATTTTAAVLLALAFAAPAQAARVSVSHLDRDSSLLRVTGSKGERNDIRVTHAPRVKARAGHFVVRDRGSLLLPGPGCARLGSAVVCDAKGRLIDEVRVRAGDGADRVHVSCRCIAVLAGQAGDDTLSVSTRGTSVVSSFVTGGPGRDRLTGSRGRDTLDGGAGADSLSGGAEEDTLEGGAGSDTVAGGPGRDAAAYRARTTGVIVDLAAGTGGGTGERDAFSGIEDVVGGRGGDRIMGDDGPNRLYGGEETTASTAAAATTSCPPETASC